MNREGSKINGARYRSKRKTATNPSIFHIGITKKYKQIFKRGGIVQTKIWIFFCF